MTRAIESELRQAGATDELLAILRELAPKPAQIVLETSPAAQIYLDDAFKGQASPQGRLVIDNAKPGDHTLRVSLAGKKDYARQVTLIAGQAATVKATLADLAGSIRVQTSAGAEVFLDNSSRGRTGESGQVVIPDVTGGGHDLRVSGQGKKEYRQSIQIVAGQETKIDAKLADLEPTAGAVRENPKDGLKYVWIPPGTFQMGCSPGDSECRDPEKPSHQVTLTRAFWLGQTEVTAGAYKRFAAATGRRMPPIAPDFNKDWANNNMPIVMVTWDDAKAYCGWAGGRLPTEAEWEYAARGGSTEARYGPLDEVAWYANNSGQQRLDSTRIFNEHQKNYFERLSSNSNGAHEVGQKRANGFGLFDMLGNVEEWMNDWYDENYYQNSPSQDPPGPTAGQKRVLRGGSWQYFPGPLRVSFRFWRDPGDRINFYVGFRCGVEAINP